MPHRSWVYKTRVLKNKNRVLQTQFLSDLKKHKTWRTQQEQSKNRDEETWRMQWSDNEEQEPTKEQDEEEHNGASPPLPLSLLGRKNTMKKNTTELRCHCLRRFWFGISDLLFRFVVPSCFFWFVGYSFVFQSVPRVSVCFCFGVFLFWCSSCFCFGVWNLCMELESLKLEFHTGNWVLKTRVLRGLFLYLRYHQMQIET